MSGLYEKERLNLSINMLVHARDYTSSELAQGVI